MENTEFKLPLGLCKQAAMKLEAFIHDVMEIKEDPDLDAKDREDFETMAEMGTTMLATLINMVNSECAEHEFLGEKIPMDDIDPYPGDDVMDDTDIINEPIE